jgi:DNA-binding IclR family transcriptional regulator
MNSAPGIKSAVRVLEMLEMLSTHPGRFGVSDLARRLVIPKSSTHMLLETLQSRGYVVRDANHMFGLHASLADGRWVGGPRAVLARVAGPAAERVARATGESCFVGMRRDDECVEYVVKAIGAHDLRSDAPLATARPLHATATGLALLAFGAPEGVERLLSGARLERFTRYTLCDGRAIKRELAAIRKRGYSLNRHMYAIGESGIAVPIVEDGGAAIAAIGSSFPDSRYPQCVERTLAELRREARRLSREIGGGR